MSADLQEPTGSQAQVELREEYIVIRATATNPFLKGLGMAYGYQGLFLMIAAFGGHIGLAMMLTAIMVGLQRTLPLLYWLIYCLIFVLSTGALLSTLRGSVVTVTTT